MNLPQLLQGGEIDLIDKLRCEFHPERFPAHQSLHDMLLLELASRTRLVHWV